jgi:hypothetical protein
MSEFYKYLKTGKFSEAMDNVNPNGPNPQFVELKKAIEQAIAALYKSSPVTGRPSPTAPITNQILHHLTSATMLINQMD